MNTISLAVIQFAPIYKNIEANLTAMCDNIASIPADMLVFPELSLTGYAFSSSEEGRPYSLSATSPAILAISEAARAHKKAIVFGYIEQEAGLLYNSALLIDTDGSIKLNYRKVHLFYYEKKVFAPGNLGFGVASIHCNGNEVRIGIQICYDWRFPEATRSLALQGAEIVALPSNIVTTTGMLETTLRTRAFENKVILAFADRIGTEELHGQKEESLTFRGESMIINYNGEILSKLSGSAPSIAISEVDPQKTRNKDINFLNNILSDRNENQYFK